MNAYHVNVDRGIGRVNARVCVRQMVLNMYGYVFINRESEIVFSINSSLQVQRNLLMGTALGILGKF